MRRSPYHSVIRKSLQLRLEISMPLLQGKQNMPTQSSKR
jgi:hypothetical protein